MAEEARFTNYWEPEDEDNIYNPDDLNYGRDYDYYDGLMELKELRNWVCYKLEPRENGKQKKIPVNPRNGSSAKANDPTTWGTYEEAYSAIGKNGISGTGFQFGTAFQGYLGIDLDNVVQADGTLKPFAEDIVRQLNSYTEYSPSGKGLHIICRSSKGMESWGYTNVSHRDDSIGLEMYDSKRYFTITENVYMDYMYINDRTVEVKQVYDKYLKKETSPRALNSLMPPMPPMPPKSPTQQLSVMNMNMPISEEDRDLWQKMFKSKNGEKIKALFSGDIRSYGNDDSRADLALCSCLAYWTGKDPQRMDRMFRQSKLMRPKWDEGNNPTYGWRTIDQAMRQDNTFTLSVSHPQNIIPQINMLPLTSLPSVVTHEQIADDISVSEYLDGIFHDDVQKFQSISKIKTGFENLDAITSLYPGLYLL